jgi:hypothetical protein
VTDFFAMGVDALSGKKKIIHGMQARRIERSAYWLCPKTNIVKTGPQNQQKAPHAQYPISVAPSG